MDLIFTPLWINFWKTPTSTTNSNPYAFISPVYDIYFLPVEKDQFTATEKTTVHWVTRGDTDALLYIDASFALLSWILVMKNWSGSLWWWARRLAYIEKEFVVCMVQLCTLEIKLVLHFYFIENFPYSVWK